MASRNSKSSTTLSSLVEQIRANLPNFLLGLTILVVFVLLSSLYLQGGKKVVQAPVQDNQAAQPTKTVEAVNEAAPAKPAKTRSLWDLVTGKKTEQPQSSQPKKYTVKEGDSLWIIAEQAYGSGFNAYDIAEANKLEDPDTVEVGMVLVIPDVTVKQATLGEAVGVMTETITIQGSEYVVKDGDSLWSIAQGAYGDGNAWSRIAQSNNLVNPDIISTGQKLTLPR